MARHADGARHRAVGRPIPPMAPAEGRAGQGPGDGWGPAEASAGGEGWASWLDETPGRKWEFEPGTSDFRSTEFTVPMVSDDPMAPLVHEARRRAEQMQRRRKLRTRASVIGGAALAVVLLAAGTWWWSTTTGDDAQQAAPAATSEPNGAGNPPAPAAWCQDVATPQRVSGAGAGDVATGPGVIMHLEYAWYVLRDAAAVRALLTPTAVAASEQATRDAISAIPPGTKHCVTITAAGADRWTVTVDERHPDGTQNSWQQIMTTTVRDGQARITSIVEGHG